MAFGLFIDTLRTREYGLPSKPLGWLSCFLDQTDTRHVCLWSEAVVPTPHDWPKSSIAAGYSYPEDTSSYAAPETLVSFLAGSDPILAVSLGSMNIPHPSGFICALSQALKVVGAKAVVSRSWPKSASILPVSDNIYHVDDIPHSWLLKHVQGFVHHGGAGHTAAGVRAGVPMLFLPFFLDQNFWAGRAHQLRLGPMPIPFRDITPQSLAMALSNLLSGQYSIACSHMASQIAADGDGATAAADLIALQIQTFRMSKPCALIADLPAQWRHFDSGLYVSGPAAASLVSQSLARWSDFELQGGSNWVDGSLDRQLPIHYVSAILFSFLGKVLQWLYYILSCGKPSKASSDSLVRRARTLKSLSDYEDIRRNFSDNHSWEEHMALQWQARISATFHEAFDSVSSEKSG